MEARALGHSCLPLRARGFDPRPPQPLLRARSRRLRVVGGGDACWAVCRALHLGLPCHKLAAAGDDGPGHLLPAAQVRPILAQRLRRVFGGQRFPSWVSADLEDECVCLVQQQPQRRDAAQLLHLHLLLRPQPPELAHLCHAHRQRSGRPRTSSWPSSWRIPEPSCARRPGNVAAQRGLEGLVEPPSFPCWVAAGGLAFPPGGDGKRRRADVSGETSSFSPSCDPAALVRARGRRSMRVCRDRLRPRGRRRRQLHRRQHQYRAAGGQAGGGGFGGVQEAAGCRSHRSSAAVHLFHAVNSGQLERVRVQAGDLLVPPPRLPTLRRRRQPGQAEHRRLLLRTLPGGGRTCSSCRPRLAGLLADPSCRSAGRVCGRVPGSRPRAVEQLGAGAGDRSGRLLLSVSGEVLTRCSA
mmetsp:Transcript_32863/g.73835  ORF Transcript_32863/g.73835 Transcript_32863/m.73835 type:complete len:410 (+) Transcript_32863:95-1324(+)